MVHNDSAHLIGLCVVSEAYGYSIVILFEYYDVFTNIY